MSSKAWRQPAPGRVVLDSLARHKVKGVRGDRGNRGAAPLCGGGGAEQQPSFGEGLLDRVKIGTML